MNRPYVSSAYFVKESEARRAADDLRAHGYDVEVHSEGSHGQSFWDSIKNFFKGEQGQSEYSAGALLMARTGDPAIIHTVVRQYNGRISDVGATTTTPTMTEPVSTVPPTAGVPPSTSGTATTTIGETTSGTKATEELERERIRTTGGTIPGGTTGTTPTDRGSIDNSGL